MKTLVTAAIPRLQAMELFECPEHYVIVSGASALWCSRVTGALKVRPVSSLDTAWNPVCLGLVRGVIGKIQCSQTSPHQLMVVKAANRIASTTPIASSAEEQLQRSESDGRSKEDSPLCVNVNRITRIGFIPLATDASCSEQFDLCPKHHFGIRKTEKIAQPTIFYTQPEVSSKVLRRL